MHVSVCRLPVPPPPLPTSLSLGLQTPLPPFRQNPYFLFDGAVRLSFLEDTAWNWCVSFPVHWGHQLAFGNSLRGLASLCLSAVTESRLSGPFCLNATFFDWDCLPSFTPTTCGLSCWCGTNWTNLHLQILHWTCYREHFVSFFIVVLFIRVEMGVEAGQPTRSQVRFPAIPHMSWCLWARFILCFYTVDTGEQITRRPPSLDWNHKYKG